MFESSNYTVGSPNIATVNIADNDTVDRNFTANPSWTGYGNTANNNNFTYSGTTNYAGGSTGEIGGTFTRTATEAYYADTALSQTFTLSNAISASGKLNTFGQVNTNQEWLLGHISSSTSDKSTIGIEFFENNSTSVRFGARMATPGGTGGSSTTITAGVQL